MKQQLKFIQAISLAFFLILTLFFTGHSFAAVDNDDLSVLTGSQVTFSLTYALLEGTDIETVNIPSDGRRLNSLKKYLERKKHRFESTFEKAVAVVAFANVIESDPLYRFAREANINLVYIDAAQPWSFDASGVALVDQPNSDVNWGTEGFKQARKPSSQSMYFWLSVSNAIRMADLIGKDLVRVFPNHSDTIKQNLNKLKAELQALSRDIQRKLLTAKSMSVFALAHEFVYLTNDLGLFVDGYFLKQDIHWTEQDLRALTARLSSRDIKVVLHKWLPNESIIKAITDAGAMLVVLNTGDTGLTKNRKLASGGYQQILRENLERLVDSLL